MSDESLGTSASEAFYADWDAFCDGLKDAARWVLEHPQYTGSDIRAAGIEQLAQLTEQSIRWHLTGGSADFPRFVQINDTAEVADNMFAPIRADATYRLTGNIAHLFDVNISVHAGWGFVEGANRKVWADIGRNDLAVDADGNFTLLLGPDVREGEGIKLEPGANYIQIREYFADWANNRPGRFELVRLGSEGVAPPHPSFEELSAALPECLGWIKGYQLTHQKHFDTVYPKETNAVASPEKRSGGNRNIQYGFGKFDLKPGEALVVSFDEPRARLWNIQWLNQWYEMTDQANRTTGLVSTQAHVDSDGRVRIVLAEQDPGCPNWLDCNGFPTGEFLVRWFWGEDNPEISCDLVQLADIRAHLPANHPHSTTEDRKALQALRRSHFASRRR